MRLIDADELKTKVEAMVEHKVQESDYDYGRNQTLDYVADILIDNAPIIDICKDCDCRRVAIEALKQEPVVRCKDCIHAENMNKPWADSRQIVFCWKHGKERFTASDWYCGDGERAKG